MWLWPFRVWFWCQMTVSLFTCSRVPVQLFLAKQFNQFMWQQRIQTIAHSIGFSGCSLDLWLPTKNESWTWSHIQIPFQHSIMQINVSYRRFDRHGEWRILVTNFHMSAATNRSQRKCSLTPMVGHKMELWCGWRCGWMLTHSSVHRMMSMLDAKLALKR